MRSLNLEKIGFWSEFAIGILILFVLSQIVMNFLFDPTEVRRQNLSRDLQSVPPSSRLSDSSNVDIDEWGQKIIDKKDLWKPLVPPPPPPPPPPPAPPKRPDVAQMLQGVKASRQQIGQKIKIFTPEEPRGVLVGVGDTVKGCKVQSFDRSTVTFVYFWQEGKEEIPYTINRE